jgi:hypothetical protein
MACAGPPSSLLGYIKVVDSFRYLRRDLEYAKEMGGNMSTSTGMETRGAKRKASSATQGTATQDSSFIDTQRNVRAVDVPDSCVGSAEYILRKIDDPNVQLPKKAFAQPGSDEKSLKAFVKNGGSNKMLQLSVANAQQTLNEAKNTQSYFNDSDEIKTSLKIGEGIGFFASTAETTPPMHCMALLKVDSDGTATLSNLDEKPNWDGLTTASLADKDNTVTGKTVGDLRAANAGTYQSAKHVSAKLTLAYKP